MNLVEWPGLATGMPFQYLQNTYREGNLTLEGLEWLRMICSGAPFDVGWWYLSNMAVPKPN